MKKIFLKKNFLSCGILILAVLVSAAILFLNQPQKTQAADACDNSCSYCTTPGIPSGLTWLTSGETQLAPTWGLSPAPSYYNLVGVSGSTLNVNTTSVYYVHTGLNPGTYYSYKVKACNSPCEICVGEWPDAYCDSTADECSAYSSTWGNTTDFKAPTGLGASCDFDGANGKANLNWTDNSSAESSYKVEYKYAGGTYSVYSTEPAGTISKVVSPLNQGQLVYFRVRAYHDSGTYSNYSNESSCTTPLSAPSGLVASAISSSQINLSWTGNSNGESGFKIERATTSPPTTEIDTVGQDVTSYSDTNLAEGTTYYYRVRAYTSHTDSSYSNESSTTTLIYYPSGYLESSTFDTGFTNGVAFVNILWKGTLPPDSHVRFRLASSTSSASTWTFLGYDGTAADYYEPSPNYCPPPDQTKICASIPITTFYHNNHRYFRYRIYLYPAGSQSPTVTDVIIGYSP